MSREEYYEDGVYSFKDDPSNSFKRSLEVHSDDVTFPSGDYNGELPIELSIQKILPSDGEFLQGRDDHLGTQVIRSQDIIRVFPRLCPHNGPSLDKKNFEICTRQREVPIPGKNGYKIMCPWHGRLFEPIASFDLKNQETQIVETRHLLLRLTSGKIFIEKK